ncbi:MAG: penicillin acylase family protein [Candidatus Helarchaeota archaeon]
MKNSLIIKLSSSIIGAIVFSIIIITPMGGFPGLGNLLSPIGGIWNGSNNAEYPTLKVISGSGYSGTVYRDELGIPHIFASTYDDLAYIMGYLQATDRLFSMDMQRRLVSGRLAELMGEYVLEQDKFMRLMGFERSGKELWNKILEDAPYDPELQKIISGLQAYCAGVNRYIDEIIPYNLPLEYVYLGIQPYHWTETDVMTYLKFESYALSFNEFDLLMTLLKDTLGNETVNELIPYTPYPFEKVVVPDFSTNASGGTPKSRGTTGGSSNFDQSSLKAIPEYKDELENILKIFQKNDILNLKEGIVQTCSNNWVINGSLSYSGKPILCNDPHLPLTLPPIWWEFQFVNSSPGSNDSIYGVAFPGTPLAEIGHTNYIAWGCTVSAYDQNDFYLEKLTPDGTKYYFNKTELREIESVTEVINIKNQDPYYYTIKFTRHNWTAQDDFQCPIINSTEWGYPGDLNISIKWTGFSNDYGIIKAFFRLNNAKSIQDYLSAMEVYSYPGQNFIFADVAGNIAIYPKANYPVRNVTGTIKYGQYLLNGSNGEDEWTGYIPFDWIPHKINPSHQMFLASANQRTVNTSEYTTYYTSYAFASSHRGRRINQILENESLYNSIYGSTISIERMKKIQTDYYDIGAEVFVPYLLQAFNTTYPSGVPNTGDWELINRSIEILQTWNSSKDRWIMDKDLIAPTIFDTWIQLYVDNTLTDEFENVSVSISGYASYVLIDFVENLTRYNQSSKWFDNITTPEKENATKIMLIALNDTIQQLSQDLGAFENWLWGNYHIMDIKYMMGMMSGLDPFDFQRYGCSGSSRTINVASGKYVRGGPSMRFIVDFERLSNNSLYSGYITIPGGQSGNRFSSHYSDEFQYWKNNKYHLILFPRSISRYPSDKIYSTVLFS